MHLLFLSLAFLCTYLSVSFSLTLLFFWAGIAIRRSVISDLVARNSEMTCPKSVRLHVTAAGLKGRMLQMLVFPGGFMQREQ